MWIIFYKTSNNNTPKSKVLLPLLFNCFSLKTSTYTFLHSSKTISLMKVRFDEHLFRILKVLPTKSYPWIPNLHQEPLPWTSALLLLWVLDPLHFAMPLLLVYFKWRLKIRHTSSLTHIKHTLKSPTPNSSSNFPKTTKPHTQTLAPYCPPTSALIILYISKFTRPTKVRFDEHLFRVLKVLPTKSYP